eukprot:4090943-Amphidinium_carterae.1
MSSKECLLRGYLCLASLIRSVLRLVSLGCACSQGFIVAMAGPHEGMRDVLRLPPPTDWHSVFPKLSALRPLELRMV